MSLVLSWRHALPQEVKLILASQSPRRKEILDMMGLGGANGRVDQELQYDETTAKYQVLPSPLDERSLQEQLRNMEPRQYTQRLAEEKAKALCESITTTVTTPTLVLGSDTIVDLDGHILEKPNHPQEARDMLGRLSNQQHYVHTGVAIYLIHNTKNEPITVPANMNSSISITRLESFVDTATVTFGKLSERDIEAYIDTKEPMDKAGAYGIQGMGGQFVTDLQGDFFTVMGLPMHRTSRALASAIRQVIEPAQI